MIPAAIRRFTRFLCPDRDWPIEAQEAAGHIIFRDEDGPLGPMVKSRWELTPDEIAAIIAGATFVDVTIVAREHPHMALDVVKEPREIAESDLVHAA